MSTLTLDEILAAEFHIGPELVAEAKKTASERGIPFGDVLVSKKALTETQFLRALGSYYGLPVWDTLPKQPMAPDFTGSVPIQFLKKHRMVAVYPPAQNGGQQPQAPVIAVNDPANIHALDDFARMVGPGPIKTVLAPAQEITSAINLAYDLARDSTQQLVEDMEQDTDAIIMELEKTADLLDDTSDAPIIKLVNHILGEAVKARASDIHIEPYQTTLKVRYRVDGLLYDLTTPPKRIHSALVSRVKVMAQLNIAEKRLPQDGRIEIRIGDKNVDIRVSTIPTAFGERLVMRLLDKSSTILRLPDLGLAPKQREIIDLLIRQPHGIILVTGPTGSGKTTTLYAVLSTINTPELNIITIEDPVEYQIEGIGQIQVNPKINLTFARGLRSIVRQDPDVILVGEIRDQETAQIAVQSSLTGHLVFSTLHTNDSASAITRLIDMQVEPFLISSSVLAVVAQRLVRVLCNSCKTPYTPDEAALATIGLSPDDLAGHTVYKANGCQECLRTGYHGRVGIFEIMLLDKSIQSLILSTSDSNQIKAQAVANGMVTLRRDGVRKVLEGVTSIEEVFRVTQM
ncbi:MAG: type II secretion system ATPase GspE [Desulfatibacillaceae bacterium]|nr:type II secretion system ATPase GspE [Desulfatibacillaceae bacterium]